MNIKRMKHSLKNRGIKGVVQRGIQKAIGLGRLQEEVDSLYYFLNNLIDISGAGPTKDKELRGLQNCNTELLNIFHKMCSIYGLTYWLDFGTLLGAIRHNGFIPWDDDIDVAMPREDYNKVIGLMKHEMAEYGIDVMWGGFFDERGPMARLAFAYKTMRTGAWIDIFPVDTVYLKSFDSSAISSLNFTIREYQRFYMKKEHIISVDDMNVQKNKYFEKHNKGNVSVMFHGCEFRHDNDEYAVMLESDVLPVKLHRFEEHEFFVPADYDKYLKVLYGNKYYDFPRRGIENHRDPDGALAKERARKTNTDINAEIDYLKSVANKLEKYYGK